MVFPIIFGEDTYEAADHKFLYDVITSFRTAGPKPDGHHAGFLLSLPWFALVPDPSTPHIP